MLLLSRQDSGIKFGEQPESPSHAKTEIRKVADTDSSPHELEAHKQPRSELMTLTDNFIQLLGLKPETDTKDSSHKVFVCRQEFGHAYKAYNETNHDACTHASKQAHIHCYISRQALIYIYRRKHTQTCSETNKL